MYVLYVLYRLVRMYIYTYIVAFILDEMQCGDPFDLVLNAQQSVGLASEDKCRMSSLCIRLIFSYTVTETNTMSISMSIRTYLIRNSQHDLVRL